jgi:hypothetical protein
VQTLHGIRKRGHEGNGTTDLMEKGDVNRCIELTQDHVKQQALLQDLLNYQNSSGLQNIDIFNFFVPLLNLLLRTNKLTSYVIQSRWPMEN